MNSLEIIRSLKAKTIADAAAAVALDNLLCAKRDALAAPFLKIITDLGHLVSNRELKTLATSMGFTPSIHNHIARFEIRVGYDHVLGGEIKGESFIIRLHLWKNGHPNDATLEQATDHLLGFIARQYNEPA